VSNIDSDYKVYSFNSILNVAVGNKDNEIANFDLFPSLLYKHNPDYNDALK